MYKKLILERKKMSQTPDTEDDKINLNELFAVLWSHKLFIVMVSALSIFLSAYYALTAKKEFTASSTFHIEETKGGSMFSLGEELGALASLAGLNSESAASKSNIILERAMEREFIINVKEKFSIERDLFFNSYNPDHKDPFWKALIKKAIGWEKTELEKNSVIENNIINNYRKNVKLKKTDGGAIIISVTHNDPKKAAEYANNFMEEIQNLVENESIAAQTLRLNYLSEILADALQEMDKAQENLKNYALENNAMAQENFISDSLKLDQLRMEKRKVSEIADLLSTIESFVKTGNLDSNSYDMLRMSHPLVDDIDFRRILGMSETISVWNWPEIETINAVSATLRDRIKRLSVDIKNIEEMAKIYASSAESLAKFKRDAKIAEATYTVLIEQVKSQSLAAGFHPDNFKVFGYATPPLYPSSPKRNLVLATGAVLGMFVGCALALLNAIGRDVYYSRSMLFRDVNADLELKARPIRRLSRKPFSDIILSISNREISVLDKASLKIAQNKVVYVLNSGGRLTASNSPPLSCSKCTIWEKCCTL